MICPLLLVLFFLQSCESGDVRLSPDLRSADLEEHIEWLADSTLAGRLAGSPGEARAANYILNHFRQFGLEPAGDEGTYLQLFQLDGPIAEAMGQDRHLSRNVIALVPGTSRPDEVIVLGAHYDGQGHGGVISLEHEEVRVVHPGADDNASGVAGLLELAHYFSESPAQRTLLFAAFSGEELGLIGSRHMVTRPPFQDAEFLAMVNLDMIGRLRGQQLTISGTGTMDLWEELLSDLNRQAEPLQLEFVNLGSASSDHTSFHENGIPALHLFTGTHEDYHRPGDLPEKINIEGALEVLRFVQELITGLDQLAPDEFLFSENEGRE
ncbi:MAG: M20/M25/M40 family metallo-hydrolase [Balneolaceae bacterium]